MRLMIKIGEDGRLHWTLLRSAQQPDPVAYGVRSYREPQECYGAAAGLLRARAELMRAVEQPDGQWRWVVADTDGQPLALSSSTFDNPAACGYALHDVRHAMALERGYAQTRP